MFIKVFFKITLFLFVLNVSAQKYTNVVNVTKKYKGDVFLSTNTLFENLKTSEAITVVSEILKNKELRSIIENEEMVTIFVPLDAAFKSLSKKEREAFLLNTDLQSKLLKMHSVPGRIDAESLRKSLERKEGKVLLQTLAGTRLIVTVSKKGTLYITDSKGAKMEIVATDFYHKKGFFHLAKGAISPLVKEK